MPSRKVVFGLIGCGIYGMVHAGVLRNDPRVELKGLWSFTQTRRELSARMLGCRPYGTWRELVDDPEIDCVSITTPDFAHTEYAIGALKAGKNVLLEKPMAMSRDGKILMVNYHNRWYPAFIAARDAILAGTIGRPAAASFVLSDTISWVEQNMKWADRSGPEWFLMSHIADLACWMLGDRPSEVFAMAREGLLKSRGYGTRDLVTATARMSGGAVVQLETSWILARNWRNPVNDMRVVVHGEEGRIDIVADYENLAVTTDRYLTPYTLNEHTETRPIRDFITCVLEEKPPPVTGEDGLLATGMIQAVVRSYTENRSVRMDEIV